MIYKSERSKTASNDPRLPVVDSVEESTSRLDVLLSSCVDDDDGDDDDGAAETSDEDYNVPLAVSSNMKPQKTGRTRKTPPAKVSFGHFQT